MKVIDKCYQNSSRVEDLPPGTVFRFEGGCPDNHVHMIAGDTGKAIDLETGQVFPLAGEAVVVYEAELVLRRKS